MNGSRRAAAIPLAALIPTSSAPISPGLGQRHLDHRLDQLQVVARRDLGDDPAEPLVGFRLRGDHVAEDARAVEDGGAGVIAGGLDR